MMIIFGAEDRLIDTDKAIAYYNAARTRSQDGDRPGRGALADLGEAGRRPAR